MLMEVQPAMLFLVIIQTANELEVLQPKSFVRCRLPFSVCVCVFLVGDQWIPSGEVN